MSEAVVKLTDVWKIFGARAGEAMAAVKSQGIGKPEALKHALSGYWSRRIDGEHRMVYKVEGDVLFLAQLRYHY